MLEPSSIGQLFSSLDLEQLSYHHTWLVQGQVMDVMGGVYLPITSQVYSFIRIQQGVRVEEMYMIDKGLGLITRNVGYWNWNGESLSWDESPLFERRRDLQGYQFEAVVQSDPPSTKVLMNEDGAIRISGIFGRV